MSIFHWGNVLGMFYVPLNFLLHLVVGFHYVLFFNVISCIEAHYSVVPSHFQTLY